MGAVVTGRTAIQSFDVGFVALVPGIRAYAVYWSSCWDLLWRLKSDGVHEKLKGCRM